MRGIIQKPGYDPSCSACGGGGRLLILDTQDDGPIPCYTLAERDGCPLCEERALRGSRRAFREANDLHRDIMGGKQFGLKPR